MKSFSIVSILFYSSIIYLFAHYTPPSFSRSSQKSTTPPLAKEEAKEALIEYGPPIPDADQRAVNVLAKVICGEVGPHFEETGRNVLQVIINRAALKLPKHDGDLAKAAVSEATRRLNGVPQFATYCRSDNKAKWQTAIAESALRGDFVSNADWISESVLFFRTHSGAHHWMKRRGWTRNIKYVGGDKYHSFFEANETALHLMTEY